MDLQSIAIIIGGICGFALILAMIAGLISDKASTWVTESKTSNRILVIIGILICVCVLYIVSLPVGIEPLL